MLPATGVREEKKPARILPKMSSPGQLIFRSSTVIAAWPMQLALQCSVNRSYMFKLTISPKKLRVISMIE